MAKEICISSTPHETRLAILEDDQLAEIYYERENEYTLAGSIYNGRVTRVLPGMQSAFVDIGLERDAFLYVTDFLELEETEDAEELERAAIAAPAAPREVRPSERNGQRPDRTGHDRPGQDRVPHERASQERAPQERPERQARSEAEPLALGAEAGQAEPGARDEEDESTGGARRWRGRRRRRSGRGAGEAQTGSGSGSGTEAPSGSQTGLEPSGSIPHPSPEAHRTPADLPVEAERSVRAERTERGGRTGRSERTGRGERGDRSERSERGDRSDRVERAERAEHADPVLLPGESLSKYGATPAEGGHETGHVAGRGSPSRPASPAVTSRPSTLIESLSEWDGVGALPGESISRHRDRGAAPESSVEVPAEPEGTFSDAATHHAGHGHPGLEIVEEEARASHPVQPAGPGPASEAVEEELLELSLVEEEEDALEEVELEEEEPGDRSEHARGGEEPGPDASASHHVDPLPPSGFRIFGLGGRKRRSEDSESGEEEQPAPEHAPAPAEGPRGASGRPSSFSPGNGVIEEELIEGEEGEAPLRHPHRADDPDLDEYEEETLQTQIRSGELGEMLQEAHLDHRIQLNFEEKNGDEEEETPFEGEEEESEGQPAAAEGQVQPRRERAGRGRRGRGHRPGERRGGPPRRSAQTSSLPIISDLLKPGQEILVQIAKEPIAKKGARITSHIALPGRFLVFMPTVTHVGVSRKIASDEERQRLKRILLHERGEASGGFIVRTAAEGASEEELRADLRFLIHLWNEIKQRSDGSKSPALIYHDLSLIERILRDQVSANFSSIWVDSEADYERIVRFLNRFSPTLVRRVKLYTKETPLFEHFGIQDEISKALRSKVWLKSGGSIVINQTEALVAIDINTGKYVGKTARLEDTIVKTNLDAIPEIVRQIRLRDLGGIIIIDFIDMDERKNRYRVMAALEEALKNDRAPTKVLQFNDFGLVAITRKRVKQSLERTLSVPCPVCQATGMVKSPATVCNEIFIELRKMRKHFENPDVLVRVNPETVKVLKANNARWLTDFEELTGKNILVKSDATLHPEQFDIQG